jgi:hypothetical protein
VAVVLWCCGLGGKGSPFKSLKITQKNRTQITKKKKHPSLTKPDHTPISSSLPSHSSCVANSQSHPLAPAVLLLYRYLGLPADPSIREERKPAARERQPDACSRQPVARGRGRKLGERWAYCSSRAPPWLMPAACHRL